MFFLLQRVWHVRAIRGRCNACRRAVGHRSNHVGDVSRAQGLLASLVPTIGHGQGRELGDPRERTDDIHDVDSASLWLRAGRRGRTDLEDGSHNVCCSIGHIGHDTLCQVKGPVAVSGAKCVHLLDRLHGGQGPCRDKGLPAGACIVSASDLQKCQPVLAEVAVFLHRSAHGGHLAEVGHQGRPVSGAEGSAVDSGTAGVGREGEVGGDPGHRGDEACDAGRTAGRRVVGAADAVVLDGLVQEDHGLSQVGSSLDDVDDAFRANPWQLFGLGLVE
mmetsp:Transcript_65578/g.143823  ORF Transcript_65578/g.143823 Transcript_65578/m.143823 type:complete len:275 (-) Transcript_65578:337-1161(-)